MLPWVVVFLLGAFALWVVWLWQWLGRSPRRELVARWSFWRALGMSAGAFALGFLLDPDVGIVKQGAHMYLVGPLVFALLLGAPTLLVRWVFLRRAR